MRRIGDGEGPAQAPGGEDLPAQLRARFGDFNFNYRFHLSLKNSYLYVELPKAACSTIKARLFELETRGLPPRFGEGFEVHDKERSPLLSPYQLDAATLRRALSDPRFPRFAFVRDPFSRALSAWLDKIVRCEPQKRQWLQAAGRDPEAEFGAEVSFCEFLEGLAKLAPGRMDPHWAPASFLLAADRLRYAFIGRFERLEADWETLWRFLTQEPPAREGRARLDAHATGAADRLEEHYGPRETDLVRRIYAEDFEAFDYPAEPGAALRAPA